MRNDQGKLSASDPWGTGEITRGLVSDPLKSLLDQLGLQVDTGDPDVLAKAAEAAGVLVRLVDFPKSGLPDVKTISQLLHDKQREGVIEWAPQRPPSGTRISASKLAGLWENAGGNWCRLVIPMDAVPRVSPAVLRHFTTAGARPDTLSLLQRARWKGRWHWPVRIGVLPDAQGVELGRQLERTSMVGRGLAVVRVLDTPDENCDMLLVPQVLEPDIRLSIEPLRDNAIGLIALLGGSELALGESVQQLAGIRDAGGAGAGILLALEDPAAMADWTNGVVAELSHNLRIDEALWVAGRRRVTHVAPEAGLGVSPAAPLLVSTPEALSAPPLASAMRRMIRQASALPASARVVVSPVVNTTLGASLGTTASGHAVAASLDTSLKHADNFLREGGGATGAAAVNKAIHDAATEDERLPDVSLFAFENGKAAARVPSLETLVLNRPYVLEFAIRSQRVGIGFDAEPRPIRGVPKADCDLLIAFGAEGEDGLVDIPEPTQILRLPKSGDSAPVTFLFTPRRIPDRGELRLELHVYYRFNLVDHLIVRTKVTAASAHEHAAVHSVLQRDVHERYDADSLPARQPRQMNIHVTHAGDAYRLKIAIAKIPSDGSKVEMTAYARITSDDLTLALERLRDLLMRSALDVYGDGLRVDPAAEKKSWEDYAGGGRELWHLLFRGDQGGSADNARRFLEANPLPEDSAVQIVLGSTARSFVFPWSMLHDGRGNGDPGAGFWGLRYVIEQKAETTVVAQPLSSRRTPPEVSVMLSQRLRETTSQLALIEAVCTASGRKVLNDAPIESKDKLQKLLADSDAQLLYFFCQGYTPFPVGAWLGDWKRFVAERAEDDENLSALKKALDAPTFREKDAWIELTRNTVILRELELEPVDLRGQPMVIMNMCQSAQVLPQLTSSFVHFFLRKRARSVLGTECPIPPKFASAFALELMPLLLSGAPIGQALLETRRCFAQAFGNPLGLAYSLWGAADAKYEPAAIDAATASKLRLNFRKEIGT